jgi:hypothetical protein
MGMVAPPFMGMAMAINFQPVGNKAVVTGDFVLLAEETNPVVQALVRHNIQVTAVHNHMLYESSRLFFLHFWGYSGGIMNLQIWQRGLASWGVPQKCLKNSLKCNGTDVLRIFTQK